jgi:hypothetical protein
MKRITLLMLILFFTALDLPARSCSAAGVIADHVKWLAQGSGHVVRATAVSNQRNRLASYAEGELTITGQPFPGSGAPTFLGGVLKQYFSDRRFDLPASGAASVPRYPFSPTATDSTSLNLDTNGSITLTLKSWGNTSVRLTDVSCAAGVLHGVTDNTTGIRSFYAISFSKEKKPGALK